MTAIAAMTVAEARNIVSGRLVFGESRHIEAVALVERSRKFLQSDAGQSKEEGMLANWDNLDFEEAELEYEWQQKGWDIHQ